MGLPEYKEGSKEPDDDYRVRKLLAELQGGVAVRIGLIERFGVASNPSGSQKPRNIRIVIEDFSVRRNLLLLSKRLKERRDCKQLYIVPDLTRAQQSLDKKLRDKLKEFKTNGEVNMKVQKAK